MMPGKSNKPSAEKADRDIRRATRRRYSAEEKIRIVLEGLRGEDSIAELCRREGLSMPMSITAGLRSSWKLARSARPVIHREKPPQVRSRICAVKPPP